MAGTMDCELYPVPAHSFEYNRLISNLYYNVNISMYSGLSYTTLNFTFSHHWLRSSHMPWVRLQHVEVEVLNQSGLTL